MDDMSDDDALAGAAETLFWGTNVPPIDSPPVLELSEAIMLLGMTPGTLDVIELCGGEGRTTRVAARHRLNLGGNFDAQLSQKILFLGSPWIMF